MIILTGATGGLGRQIVEGLAARVPAEQIGVSVRDPQKAESFRERGIRVRRGDFADPASLASAFEDASQVLIISVNSLGNGAVQQHGNAIAAAKAAGAERILYTSHMGASADSAFEPCKNHAATEALLQQSGVPYTSLRNGFYAESAALLLGNFRETGEIVVPQDGPVSWTTRKDLAGAAVIALTEPEKLNEITPALTAKDALDFTGIAEILSDLAGRQVRRRTVSTEEFFASRRAAGTPEQFLPLLGGLFEAAHAGEFAAVDPTLGQLLGCAPATMRSFLSEGASRGHA